MTILEWFNKWEPVWLFVVLFPEAVAGIYSAWILTKEYKYDEAKDLQKKQKRTKTTKKTTTNPGGTVVEESIEVSEPVAENLTKGEMR
jgi:hypothetical protein